MSILTYGLGRQTMRVIRELNASVSQVQQVDAQVQVSSLVIVATIEKKEGCQ